MLRCLRAFLEDRGIADHDDPGFAVHVGERQTDFRPNSGRLTGRYDERLRWGHSCVNRLAAGRLRL